MGTSSHYTILAVTPIHTTEWAYAVLVVTPFLALLLYMLSLLLGVWRVKPPPGGEAPYLTKALLQAAVKKLSAPAGNGGPKEGGIRPESGLKPMEDRVAD